METKTKLYYGQDKTLDKAVELLIRREVLHCQSSLIETMLGNPSEDSLNFEDCEGLYADPSDWDTEQCRQWIDEHGGLDDTHEREDDEDEDDYTERLREAVSDSASEYPAEVYEWWLVTDWIAGKLQSQGEVILSAYNCHWWGRQCTGQSIKLDPTFYDIFQDSGMDAEAWAAQA